MRPEWYVPDPWPERIRQAFFERVWCPTFGHKWGQKMYDEVCWRCSHSRPSLDRDERLYLIAKQVTDEVLGPGTWQDPRGRKRAPESEGP